MVSGNVSHDVWNGSTTCAFGCNSDVQSGMMEQLVLPEERLASQMETSPILDKHLTVMSWSEKEVDSARRCRFHHQSQSLVSRQEAQSTLYRCCVQVIGCRCRHH